MGGQKSYGQSSSTLLDVMKSAEHLPRLDIAARRDVAWQRRLEAQRAMRTSLFKNGSRLVLTGDRHSHSSERPSKSTRHPEGCEPLLNGVLQRPPIFVGKDRKSFSHTAGNRGIVPFVASNQPRIDN